MKLYQRCLAVGLGAALAVAVQAQEVWLSKPLRVVVPFAPGAPGETIVRLIQPALTQASASL